jgi:hypothetical protein
LSYGPAGMNINDLSIKQLKKVLTLKERIARLEAELTKLTGAATASETKTQRRKGKMSASGRARIAAAQKKRWAKIKAAKM